MVSYAYLAMIVDATQSDVHKLPMVSFGDHPERSVSFATTSGARPARPRVRHPSVTIMCLACGHILRTKRTRKHSEDGSTGLTDNHIRAFAKTKIASSALVIVPC